MATERVNIIFQTRGVRRVRRDVGGIGNDARTSATAVGFLKASLGGLGVGIAAREFVRFSDTATRLTNQIRLVSTDTANLNRVMAELHQVARDTRSGIEPTAELYSRLQRSARTLGLSQQELLDLTTGVSQAFKIFGNTSAEAEAALVQFSQGLAAGALRGDELRSVLEQAPRLAQAIADGLNEIGDANLAEAFGQGFRLDDGSFDFDIVIGSLRELGAEGELTAERVITALQTQLEVLDQEFGTTLPTIEDAFEQLRNKVVALFQSSEFQTVSAAVANVVLFISDNFELLTQVVGTAAFVLGTVLAVTAVGAAIAGLQALFVLLLANPFTALILVIVAAIGYILLFGDKVAGVTGGTATLRDEFVAAFRTIRDIVAPVVGFLGEAFGGFFTNLFPALGLMAGNWRESIEAMWVSLKNFIVNATGSFVGLNESIKYIFENFPDIIKDVAIRASNSLIDNFETGLNKLIDLWNKAPTQFFKAFNAIGPFITDTFNNVLETLEQIWDNLPTVVLNAAREAVRKMLELFELGLAKLVDAFNSLPGFDIDPPDLTSGIESQIQAAKDTITKVGFQQAVINSLSIEKVSIARIENEYEGAAAGIGEAFERGTLRGQVRAADALRRSEEAFNSNLAQVEAERRAREAREALGALTTLNSGAGTPVGTIGDDSGSGGSNGGAARRKEMEALEEHNRLLEQNAALRGEEREAMSAADLIRQTSGDLAERNVNIQASSIEQLRELIGLEANSAEVTKEKQSIVAELQTPLAEYVTQMTALNQLLAEGAISQGQFNEQVANLATVQELADLDSQLEGTRFFFEAQIQELRDHQQSMLNTVAEAWETRLITEQDAASRMVAINAKMNREIRATEAARNSGALKSASDTFGSLADMSKAFAGEQSGIYKVMFAASKAFAIADSIIKIQQGIANAMSLPFPANIGAAATVAAEAANIVSSIQAVTANFRDGGYVMGPGTGTSDSVPANLSNGEFVINAQQTSKYRDLLEGINSGHNLTLMDMGAMPKFSAGGLVGTASAVAVPMSVPVGNVSNRSTNQKSVTFGDVNVSVDGSSGDEQQDQEHAEKMGEAFREAMRAVALEVMMEESGYGGYANPRGVN